MNPRILRFLVSGGSAASAEYLAFITLHAICGNEHLMLSQSLSFACGFVISFMLTRQWVFRSEGKWGRELLKYLVLAAANLLIGNILIAWMANDLSLPSPLAKVFVMATIAVWNYLVASRLVFRPAPRD